MIVLGNRFMYKHIVHIAWILLHATFESPKNSRQKNFFFSEFYSLNYFIKSHLRFNIYIYFHRLTILAIFPFHPHVCPHIDRKVHTPSYRHCAMILSAKVERWGGGRGETVGEGTCRVEGEEVWVWALYRACQERVKGNREW